MPPLSKVAVITGATGALGSAVARGLAAHAASDDRWHIVAIGHSKRKLEQLDDALAKLGAQATLVPYDFGGDLTGLNQLGLQLHERFGKLDALIMTAGMLGPLMPVTHLDTATLLRLQQVNAGAHHALLRTCQPLLAAAPSATVVFTTCTLGADTNAYWGGYQSSKAAFAALGTAYAAETQHSAIRTILFDPGAFASPLHRDAYPGIALETLPTAEQAAFPLITKVF